MTTEPDLSKLPKWAQRHIETLTRDLAHAHAKLSEGPGNSDTFADDYVTPARPLGRETRIVFYVSEPHPTSGIRDYIDCRLDDGRLHVSGTSPLIVEPRSANGVDIRLAGR